MYPKSKKCHLKNSKITINENLKKTKIILLVKIKNPHSTRLKDLKYDLFEEKFFILSRKFYFGKFIKILKVLKFFNNLFLLWMINKLKESNFPKLIQLSRFQICHQFFLTYLLFKNFPTFSPWRRKTPYFIFYYLNQY